MKYDFTTYKYRSFLEHLIDINFPIYTISDWIEKQPKNGIILRHDVDRNTNQAIKIATMAIKPEIDLNKCKPGLFVK